MKYAVISTIEEKTPPLHYGGVERLAYDLGKGLNADIFGIPRTNDVKTYDEITTNYDVMFDFTHMKYFQNLDTLVLGVPFHPDRASIRFNMYTTKILTKYYPYKGIVIYPGITYIDRPNNDEGYLLFLGRFSEFKRPHIAIEVAKKLNKRIIVAGHVGRFSDSYYSTHIIRKYSDSAKFEINIDDNEKYELLSHATVLIMPSDWRVLKSIESLGIVAMEAMVSGCPVITSGEGTAELLSFGKDVVEGELMEGGVYCEKDNIDCFVNAVDKITKIDRKGLRSKAREFFSVKRWVKDVDKGISKVIKNE